MSSAPVEADDALPGAVGQPTVTGLPAGYVYGVTRYADVILQGSFPARLANLVAALDRFRIGLDELRAGGGGRTVFVARFDQSLRDQQQDGVDVWGKRNITIVKQLGFDDDVEEVGRVRGHEIDMFGLGGIDRADWFPGVGVEMEWNNKDPFYDRDLNNFAALHREGAIAVGVIVTRGPGLQRAISGVIRSRDGGFKYGQSSTHWSKLVPRVNLGGGGECPLLLVGIEPERVDGIEVVHEVRAEMEAAAAGLVAARDQRAQAQAARAEAAAALRDWSARGFASRAEAAAARDRAEVRLRRARDTVGVAKADERRRRTAALDRLPPLASEDADAGTEDGAAAEEA